MDSASPSPERSPRPKPELGTDPITKKKTEERRHKLGGMLFGGGPELAEKDKKEKKEKKKTEKAEKPQPKPETETEPVLDPEPTPEPTAEAPKLTHTQKFIESLKALRREQVIVVNVEAAQPEVVRARSLAKRILAKVRRETPTHEGQKSANWRTIPLSQHSAESGQAHELDLAIQAGEAVDHKVQTAIEEYRTSSPTPETVATTSKLINFRDRLRGLIFPTLATGTGAAVAMGGGAAVRGAEMAATPMTAATTGEMFMPRPETTVRNAETGSLLFGAAALFIAGLMVGRRRGERRAEKRFEAERAELKAQLEQQPEHEDMPEVSLPKQPEKVEQMLRQEIATQKQVTVEQEQRYQQISTLPSAFRTEAQLESTLPVSEFRLPISKSSETVPVPAVVSERGRIEQRPPVTAPETVPGIPVNEKVATPSVVEPEKTPQNAMSEYAMKPIIIQRLERITGNRRSAEHVYELLKASHSNPAEILALTPEKLKAKADNVLKRDAARVVLGQTIKASLADDESATPESYEHHSLLHELEKPPAALSPKEFLLRPSKHRDRALMTVAGILVIIIGWILFF